MLPKDSASRLSRCLVACNIYVSAGQARWAPFLLDLLNDAQQECTRLRQQQQHQPQQQQQSTSLAVVHAYADGPYDRSSFHIAGSSTLVASLASHIAVTAVKTLHSLRQQELNKTLDERYVGTAAHPTVGLVDHVAVLPLSPQLVDSLTMTLSHDEWIHDYQQDVPPNLNANCQLLNPSTPTVPTGWVARTVGMALEQAGVQVMEYGYADPNQTPLAQVRKRNTQFFKALPSLSSATLLVGQSTVGAPTHFVENYNIQLVTADKRNAQTLTKWVRSRDGGLPFVEALTLPYGVHRETKEPIYEVACNVLNPTVTSTNDIDQRVQTWITNTNNHNLVRRSYRVGTTVDMCWKALQETNTVTGEQAYNKKVRSAMEAFLLSA